MNVVLWAWRQIAGGVRAEIRGWDTAKAIIAELEGRSQAPAPGPRSMPGAGPPPEPLHDCGPVVKHVAKRQGGCIWAFHPPSGKWRHVHHCGRTDFDTAEWDQRLAGGPRDGESLAEWERRIEP